MLEFGMENEKRFRVKVGTLMLAATMVACGGADSEISEEAMTPTVRPTASRSWLPPSNEFIVGANVKCDLPTTPTRDEAFLYPGQTANVKGLRITALHDGGVSLPSQIVVDTIEKSGSKTVITQTQPLYRVKVEAEHVVPRNSVPGIFVVANFECIQKEIRP